MELTRIKEIVLHTTMPVGEDDEALHFSYRVGALDPSFWDWYFDPQGGGKATIHEIVERVCVTTGITVDGEPVPATAVALRAAGIPNQVLQAMFEHVRKEARAGKLSAAPSPRTLPPAGSSASVPIGTS